MALTTYTRDNSSLWSQLKKFREQGGLASPAANLKPDGRTFYVHAIDGVGSDGNDGRSFTTPLRTMSRALELVDSLDTIRVVGVVKEQLVTPAGVHDVSIICGANQPRQATDSGTPTGGGSTWLPPASPSATTALLRVIGQGWRVANMQLVPHTSSACIEVERNAGPPERDGSHFQLIGNRLVGGTTANGIVFKGGGYNCIIEGNEFESLTGTAILSNGTGVSVPLANKIRQNIFNACTNCIAISSNKGLVIGNIFRVAADNTNNKVNLISVTAQ